MDGIPISRQNMESHPALRELDLGEKAISAGVAAFLSAVVVNPLDVAKTRLQAQAAGVPYVTAQWPQGGTAAVQPRKVGIYLPIYDVLREYIERGPDGEFSPLAPYAPLIAGSVSRSLACVICSPLELARTRMQAHKQVAGEGVGPGISAVLRQVLSTASEGPGRSWRRVGLLWTGVGAQLARDVPFSALCWSLLEPVRRHMLQWGGEDPPLGIVLGANFGAGCIAGAVAAGVTTPLDVAKTRRQIEVDPVKGRSMNTLRTLSEVYRESKWRGLYLGAVPRSMRAGPVIGFIVAFYEAAKYVIR